MLNRKEIGALGEKIVSNLMRKRDFTILEMNYLKKWGEIDIIAFGRNKIHFVEVKTVTRETFGHVARIGQATGQKDFYQPEDNIHPRKLKRITRTIQTYLAEKMWEGEWVFDCAMIYLDKAGKAMKMEYLADQPLS